MYVSLLFGWFEEIRDVNFCLETAKLWETIAQFEAFIRDARVKISCTWVELVTARIALFWVDPAKISGNSTSIVAKLWEFGACSVIVDFAEVQVVCAREGARWELIIADSDEVRVAIDANLGEVRAFSTEIIHIEVFVLNHLVTELPEALSIRFKDSEDGFRGEVSLLAHVFNTEEVIYASFWPSITDGLGHRLDDITIRISVAAHNLHAFRVIWVTSHNTINSGAHFCLNWLLIAIANTRNTANVQTVE